jgi:hypothetical protein
MTALSPACVEALDAVFDDAVTRAIGATTIP